MSHPPLGRTSARFTLPSFRAVAALLLLPLAASAQTVITYQPDDNLTTAFTAGDAYELTIASDSATENGALTGGTAVAKTGAGTLTLTGANTYTGGTTIHAGTLQVTDLAGGTTQIDSGAVLAISADGTNYSGEHNTTLTGTGTLRKIGSGQWEWGAGVLTVELDAGALIDVQAGTLKMGSYANDVWTANKASLNLATDATAYTSEANVYIDALTGSGTMKIGYGSVGLTLGVANGSGTFSGNVTQDAGVPGKLVKVGTGTQILTGTNTYTGATTVSAGTLINNGSLASAVTVESGATLGGSGTFNALVSFTSGATLAPGNSPGTQTFTGGLTLNDGTILNFELGTTSDLIAVTGGTLTGPASVNGATFNFTAGSGFTAGTYNLIDGSALAHGNLTNFSADHFALGTSIAGYTYAFALNGQILQVTATAVPEPSTYAMLVGLGVLGLTLWRRRRRA